MAAKAKRPAALTAAEKEHLVCLGTLAGTVTIMEDAMRSGNIFDPAHMERARAMGEEFERKLRLLDRAARARGAEGAPGSAGGTP